MNLRASIGPIALAASLMLVAPAYAAEPDEIVKQLYAEHPYDVEEPPGGLDLWHPMIRVHWEKLIEDNAKRMSGELEWEGEGLTFDFMTGTQEFWFDNLKVKTTIQISHEAQVMAVMDNGMAQPFVLRYGFIRDDDLGWQIAEVWREGSWTLSELIQETR